MEFTPRFGPVGWLMAVMMMKPKFRHILGKVIDGLEVHVQTGEVVGERRPDAA